MKNKIKKKNKRNDKGVDTDKDIHEERHRQHIKLVLIALISFLAVLSAIIFITGTGNPGGGVAVEFTTRILEIDNSSLPEENSLVSGKEAQLTFRIKNNKTGENISGLNPEIRFYLLGNDNEVKSHQQLGGNFFENELNLAKIQLFVANSEKGTIEVVDVFGNYDPRPQAMQSMGLSSLKLIALKDSPGQKIGDLVAGRYGDYLYVTLPKENQVAVVDTLTYEVVKYIDIDSLPRLLFLQPKSRYLWVSNEGGSSISIVDTESNTLVKTIATGQGYHQIAFSPEYAYVTNNQSNTVSVIRLKDLIKVGYTAVENAPYGIDYSNVSNEIYVTNTHSGAVTIIDAKTHNIKKLIPLSPGIEAIKFSLDGRRGVVLNEYQDTAYVIDAETSSLIKTVKTGEAPKYVIFMGEYALIYNTYSNDVTYISMVNPEVFNNEIVGNQPPLTGKLHSLTTTPYGNEAVITNPKEPWIYFMHTMYGQPMVMNSAAVGYGSDAVAIVENKLHETNPGTYQQYIKFDREGTYNVEFKTQSINASFKIEVLPDKTTEEFGAVALFKNETFRPDTPVNLQYQLVERRTGQYEENLTDLIFVVIKPSSSKGIWSNRFASKYTGNGTYEAKMTFPEEGNYMVSLASNSLRRRGYQAAYDYVTVKKVP